MLATKNLGAIGFLFAGALSAGIFLTGCSPPGTHAFVEGDRLLREGKFAPAIEKLKVATELLAEGAQPRAWNHLGLAFHRAGRPNEAAAAYQQALRMNPNLKVTRYNLGCLYFEQNNLQGAITELAAYTVLEPNVLPAWLKLGSAYLRSRQNEAAEKCYLTALQLNPSLPEALNGLGLIHLQRRDLRKTLTYLTAALEKQSNYGPALLNLAIVYHQYFNERRIALRKYHEFLELKPRPSNATAVEDIARQIEAELNPPARIVQTNLVVPTPKTLQAAISRTNVAPARTLTTSAPPALALSSPRSISPPPSVSSQPEHQPAAIKPIPDPISRPAERQSNPAQPITNTTNHPPTSHIEEPPPKKVEVVTLTNEPAPKLPDDVAPAFVPPATNSTAIADAKSSTDRMPEAPPPPLILKVRPKEEGRRFMDRLNPLTWFRSGKSTSSQTSEKPDKAMGGKSLADSETTQIAKLDSVPEPIQAPVPKLKSEPAIARYHYLSPLKPSAGDRSKAQPYFAEAFNAHHERRLGAAIEAYREAIKLDPAFFDAQFDLGLAAFEVKDWQQSLTAYEYALAIDPTSVNARYNFALALEGAAYFRDAANELEKLLAARPEETKAHFTLAKLYAERLAQNALAREHYQRVLKLDPRYPEALAIRYWLAAHP